MKAAGKTIRWLAPPLLITASLVMPVAAFSVSGWFESAHAQTQPKKKQNPAKPKPEATDVTTDPPPSQTPAAVPEASPPPQSLIPANPPVTPQERVEADVSTRTIEVTSGYSGAEIVVFGTVENSRQPSAESGFYDVVVIVEGMPTPLIARKKSRVAGLWVNSSSMSFASVPSYYAIASTRPVEEFVDTHVLDELSIGFDRVRMVAAGQPDTRISSAELLDFKSAVVRLKQGQNLFLRYDYGVGFTGRSLFRSTIELPANVPVGPLTARVYLFREGELISRYQSRVVLSREGVERVLHDFAFGQPLLYGLFTVAVALSVGFVASAVFRRRAA
jgi:uncharacterized protein (TIGR02186 family)